MSDITIAEYEYLGRRSTSTLAIWWHELNCFRWPPQLEPREHRDVPGTPRRRAFMSRIENIVAWRAMRPILIKRVASQIRRRKSQ